MNIKLTNPYDLGYRKVDKNIHSLNFTILKKFPENFDFETYVDSSDIWLRRKQRNINSIEQKLISITSTMNSSNYKEESQFEFINDYLSSEFVKTTDSIDQLTFEKAKDFFDKTYENEPIYEEYFRKYAILIPLVKGIALKKFLQDVVLPDFFRKNSDGKLIVISENDKIHDYISFLKHANLLSEYDFNDYNQFVSNGVPTLQNWQKIDNLDIIQNFLNIYSNLLYPEVWSLNARTLGLHFVFLFPNNVNQEKPKFPTSWKDIHKSETFFAGEHIDTTKGLIDANSEEREKMIHKKFIHNNKFDNDRKVALLHWYIDKIDNLLNNFLDPCNFEDDNNNIEFSNTLNHFYTLDRIVRKTKLTYLSDTPIDAKKDTFEIADLYDTISEFLKNTTPKSTTFFKMLFNPEKGKKILTETLLSIPTEFQKYFLKIGNTIYDELEEISTKSIWYKSKIQGDKILVQNRNLTGESQKTKAEFTENYIRCLRNTHHGNFNDKDNRNLRYLLFSDGNTPNSITYLPILWLMCYLDNSEKFIGYKLLPWKSYDISL